MDAAGKEGSCFLSFHKPRSSLGEGGVRLRNVLLYVEELNTATSYPAPGASLLPPGPPWSPALHACLQ